MTGRFASIRPYLPRKRKVFGLSNETTQFFEKYSVGSVANRSVSSPPNVGPVTTNPTDELIAARWQEMPVLIDQMMKRCDSADEFPVATNSSLWEDNLLSAPYHVSHAVRESIRAAVDHLHAFKQLVAVHGQLHVSAPYSLSRGALEALATAFWILHPDSQTERIERALRWRIQDAVDRCTAESGLGIAEATETRNHEIDRIGTVGRAAIPGFKTKINKNYNGYSSTTAVKYTEIHSGLDVVFQWRLCSGFAHNRPWAVQNASEREVVGIDEDDVYSIRITAKTELVRIVALYATRLLQEIVNLYELRAGHALLD